MYLCVFRDATCHLLEQVSSEYHRTAEFEDCVFDSNHANGEGGMIKHMKMHRRKPSRTKKKGLPISKVLLIFFCGLKCHGSSSALSSEIALSQIVLLIY